MSTSIASIIGMILAVVLPKIGINLGNDELTSWVQVSVVIILGAVAWVRHRNLLVKVSGTENVNAFGGIKKQ